MKNTIRFNTISKRTLSFILALLFMAMPVFGLIGNQAYVNAQTQTSTKTPTPGVTLESLQKELTQLEAQLPKYTTLETPLNEREAYARKIIDLLKKIAILQGEEENEDTLNNGKLGNGKERVLVLTDILYDGKPHKKAGYTKKYCGGNECAKSSTTNTVRVEEYPSVIRPGEAFDVMASNTVQYKKIANRGTATSNASVRIDIAVNNVRANALKKMGDQLGGGKFVKEAYDVKGRTSLRMSFTPLPTQNGAQQATTAGYKFSSVKIEGIHVNNTPARVGDKIIIAIPKADQTLADPIGVIIDMDPLRFIYKWSDPDTQPLKAEAIPADSSGTDSVASENNDGENNNSNPNNNNENTIASNSNGSNGNDSSQNQNQADANAQRSPNDPKVQALITQWINSAEPPENATEGASLNYEPWGRVHGTTETGVITLNGNPDYASSYPSHFEYLWEVKDKLDSVDHCTLSEYVNTNLSGLSSTQCVGRYKPIVPDLIGSNVTNAKKRLTFRKLNPVLKLGSVAPDEQKAMTVEKQSVTAGESLTKQSQVILTVYKPYVEKNILDNYVGKASASSKSILEAQGYEVVIKQASKKPGRSSQSKAVQAQFPSAGTQLKKGSTVTLTAYATFKRKVKVPKLIGTSESIAKQKLAIYGLTLQSKEGTEAQTYEDSHKIETQFPRAGTRIEEGNSVSVTIHTAYIPTTTVPNLVGLTAPEAKNKLKLARLNAYSPPGMEAQWPEQSERVTAQSVPAGSIINKGTQVSFNAYSRYIPPVRVPSLVGLKSGYAKRKLRTLKIRSAFSYGQVTGSLQQADQVYRQSIEPGSLVKPGTTISMVVFDGRAAKQQARQQGMAALAAGLNAASAAIASSNGSYNRGSYNRGGYSSFGEDHHHQQQRYPRTNRKTQAVIAGLSALSNAMAQSSNTGITTNRSRQQMGNSSGYGGITTNQSRQQQTNRSVSANVVSGSTGTRGDCGNLSFRPSSPTNWKGLPFEGQSKNGYQFKPSQFIRDTQGFKNAEVGAYKDGRRVLSFHISWVEQATPQAIAMYNQTLTAFKRQEQSGSSSNEWSFVIALGKRYAFARSYQSGGSKKLWKINVLPLACYLLHPVGDHAASTSGSGQSPSQNSGLYGL